MFITVHNPKTFAENFPVVDRPIINNHLSTQNPHSNNIFNLIKYKEIKTEIFGYPVIHIDYYYYYFFLTS